MDIIEQRKMLRRLIKRAEAEAKPDKCILCGKSQTSFCNSHSIPQMILRTISKNGKVLEPWMVMKNSDIFDDESGIKSTGTFRFICRECDKKFFQDYENKEALLEEPNDTMLAEIALKDMLQMLSKRQVELEMFNITQREHGGIINKEILDEDKLLDINDYSEDMDLYKRIIENGERGGFQILVWKKLPYVVPIAVQTPLTLYKDMEGIILNEIYNPDPKIHMATLHLCVFPIESETVVLMFYHKKDKTYRRLRHQLNSVSDDKKLEYINYLIFAYTENYYFAKDIEKIITTNEELHLLSQENNGVPNLGMLSMTDMMERYIPITPSEIPNLLSEEYKMIQ